MGSFQMGCVSGIDCDDYEKSVHEERIDSFALSNYEVTVEDYYISQMRRVASGYTTQVGGEVVVL